MAARNNNAGRTIRNIGLILAILLYTLIRFMVLRQGQVLGGAYFFSTFDFIMIFIIGGGFCILDVVSKHVKSHMDIDCFKNAKRVLAYGAFIGALYSLFISFLILICQNFICNKLLAGLNSKLTLRLLLPMFIFVCVSAAFKGFFIGAKKYQAAYLGLALQMLISLISVLLCTRIMNISGTKVAAVMNDFKVYNAYLSGGVALGLSVGAGIGLVIDIVWYIYLEKQLIRIDETRRMVDVYDLTIQLLSEMLYLGVAMALPLFSVLVSQIIYVNSDLSGVISADLYGIGAYYGVFGCFATGMVMFTYVFAFFDKKSLSLAFLDYNRQELRSKVNGMVKQFFIYALPFTAMIISMADVIITAITGIETSLGANIVRMGIIAVVFYSFGILFMNILIAVNKTITAIVNGLIALLLDGVFVFFLVGKFHMSTGGLILGFYAFSIIYAMLSYTSACANLKNKPKLFNSMIGPVVVAAIVGVTSLVLRLIFGLFLPVLANVIITSIICFIIMIVAYVRMGVTDYHHAIKSPVGFIVVPIGQIFGLFK